MILSKTITVKTFKNKKLKLYKSKGYDTSLEEIEINIEDVPIYCNEIIQVQCDYCKNSQQRTIADYNRIINKKSNIDKKYACSRECALIKLKNTWEQNPKKPHPNYGKEIIPEKLEEILIKRKKTNLEKYGTEHVLQNKEIKEKFKKTNLEKYGTDNYSKTDIFLENLKKFNLNKYGVEYVQQNENIKEKTKKNNLEKYGVVSTLQTEKSINNRLEIFTSDEFRKNFKISSDANYVKYIKNSISIFKCDCGMDHEFEIKCDNYYARKKLNLPLCVTCYPICEHISIKEYQLFEFIKSIYSGEIIQSYRDGLEIDIYLPELKIGFEFNGLYYHSSEFKENTYHLDKTNYFKDKDIRIIHIWEDDWNFNRVIIKSMISNLINLSPNKIHARKCYVKEITNSRISKKFLNDNHIQGFVNSNLKLGLYHKDILVAIMTFDHFEGRKKMKQNEWNLNRFCSLINTSISGAASKIISYFIKKYNPSRIVSYADKSWSIGNLYENLNFEKIHETNPDYKYIVNDTRIHKSRYRKNEKNLQFPKIYDCGKIKYELKSY
jgi:hypothetical protein